MIDILVKLGPWKYLYFIADIWKAGVMSHISCDIVFQSLGSLFIIICWPESNIIHVMGHDIIPFIGNDLTVRQDGRTHDLNHDAL